MRILISGASGFIGAPLSSYLSSKGHIVVSLSRNQLVGVLDVKSPLVSKDSFERFDVVIHLAGEPLSFSRWGKKKKEKIYKSRVEGTQLLVEMLTSLEFPPKVFISASAIGVYGNRGEEQLDESSPIGTGFLSNVCRDWESASAPLKKRGIRTIQTRFGVVLEKKGGALAKLIPFYRWGLGASLGTGRGWMSWIALDDLMHAMEFVIHSNIQGPVNFVSPHALRQEVFSRYLAKSLHRPHLFKIPAFILRLLLGETADEMLLASTHAIPSKLLQSGFVFMYPKIQNVFTDLDVF